MLLERKVEKVLVTCWELCDDDGAFPCEADAVCDADAFDAFRGAVAFPCMHSGKLVWQSTMERKVEKFMVTLCDPCDARGCEARVSGCEACRPAAWAVDVWLDFSNLPP